MKANVTHLIRRQSMLSIVGSVIVAATMGCGDSTVSPTGPSSPPPSNGTASPEACFTTTGDLERFIITAGQSIGLDASCTANATASTNFAWDLGDGRTTTGRTIEVTYDDPGDYQIRLSVAGSGGTSIASKTLRVNPRPVACFNVSRVFDEGVAPCTIRVDAGCSTGSIEEYEWFFEGGPAPPRSLPDVTVTTTVPVTEYSWAEDEACHSFRPFERHVRLTVEDESGVTDRDEDVVVFSSPVLKQ